jgi:hypothetical protein
LDTIKPLSYPKQNAEGLPRQSWYQLPSETNYRIFELGCKFYTDKIITLQYGAWRIFYSKLNSCVKSKVLEFCGKVLQVSNTKALDFIMDCRTS